MHTAGSRPSVRLPSASAETSLSILGGGRSERKLQRNREVWTAEPTRSAGETKGKMDGKPHSELRIIPTKRNSNPNQLYNKSRPERFFVEKSKAKLFAFQRKTNSKVQRESGSSIKPEGKSRNRTGGRQKIIR